VATSTSSFDLFYDNIWFFQPSILAVKDCKPVLLGVFPPADVLSTIARSRKQRVVFAVFKALCGDDVCKCHFPYCLFSVFFKLQWTTNNRINKATRELFGVILFPLCHLASSCLSILLSIVFIDMNKI